jgi:hypothetical protein
MIQRVMFWFYIGQFVFYALVAFAMFGLEQGLNGAKRGGRRPRDK